MPSFAVNQGEVRVCLKQRKIYIMVESQIWLTTRSSTKNFYFNYQLFLGTTVYGFLQKFHQFETLYSQEEFLEW